FQSAEVGKCRWLEVWAALDTPAAVSAYRQFVVGYSDAQHAAGRFVYPPKAALYGVQAWMTANHVVPDDVGLNLGLLGGLLALPLTWLGLWIVRMQPVAYANAAHFSPSAFAVLLLLSLAVGLVVGILPAWRVCRQPPAMQIKLT